MNEKPVLIIRNYAILVGLFISPIILYGLLIFSRDAWGIIPNVLYRIVIEFAVVCFVANIIISPLMWIKTIWVRKVPLSGIQKIALILWAASMVCLIPFSYYKNIVKLYQLVGTLK